MTQQEQNYHTNSAHLLGGIMGIAASLRIYADDKDMREQKLRELHGLTEFGWACLYMEPDDFRKYVYYAAVDRAKNDAKGVRGFAYIAYFPGSFTVVARSREGMHIQGNYGEIKSLKFAFKLQQFIEAESIDAFREACFRELVGDKLPSTPVV